MIREIIDQADSIVTLLLPTDMVGNGVEVIAFEIDREKNALTKACPNTRFNSSLSNRLN
jgi:hypothetical protein